MKPKSQKTKRIQELQRQAAKLQTDLLENGGLWVRRTQSSGGKTFETLQFNVSDVERYRQVLREIGELAGNRGRQDP